jgi:hypothetical protein
MAESEDLEQEEGTEEDTVEESTATAAEPTTRQPKPAVHPDPAKDMVFSLSPAGQRKQAELDVLKDRYTDVAQRYQDGLVNNDPTAIQLKTHMNILKKQYEQANRAFLSLQRKEQTAFNQRQSKAIAARDRTAQATGKIKDPATGEWIDKPEGYKKPDGVLKQFAKEFTSASNKPQLQTDRSARVKPSTGDMWNADTYFSDEDLKAIKGTTLNHSRGW